MESISVVNMRGIGERVANPSIVVADAYRGSARVISRSEELETASPRETLMLGVLSIE
jgi:hypothetical protein